MRKNVIFAALLGGACGFLATLCAKEMMLLRKENAPKTQKKHALPAPQLVVELPPEKEEEAAPVAPQIEREEPAKEEKATAVQEEKHAEENKVCYYLPQGGVWHSDSRCVYLLGKSNVLKGDREAALAAGKKRACGRCGA